MNAENHLEFKNFLRWILDAEPARRRELLENADVSEEIRSEVASLVTLENEIGDFMSLPVNDFSKDFVVEDDKSDVTLAGNKIGSYEIIRELGTGGMGAVYLAKRADGKFEQKVALKMLRREYNVEKIRRYFKRESEIQAKLEHPNIARLLDVGTTGDGVPFFAMEYVEGVSVDKFCAQNNLDLTARLKLFNKICQAVAHAHRNLIIHRDLKPSNICVNQAGEPKLLDFGISKLLGEEISNDKNSLTAFGAMTPEYASPEQIKGETVSTATDIYSLGACLYKMLTGNLPYNFKGKTNGELLKAVTEDEPTAPSAIKISSSEVPQSAIRNPQLKGDLDNIILKSLAKEPSRRYETVEQFSADIWRFIDGLPVAARHSTVYYRAGKFFRRNRISVIAATLILASLIAGTGVSLWQAKSARAAQTQAENNLIIAEKEEEKAKKEKEKVEKISRFMFKVFSYANPAWNSEGRKSGGQARVLDALDDLSGKIETEFAEEKDVQAELHHQFSEVYGRVWSYNTEPARRAEMKEKFTFHICRALRLRRDFYGEWNELVAKDMYYGAGCIGKTEDENAAVWNRAIEIFRGTNPNNINLPHLLVDYAHRLASPETAELHDIYFQKTVAATGENKYEIAERYYREALPLFRNHYKPDNLPVFITECDLSYVLAIQEKWTNFDEHFAVCRQGETEMNKHFSNSEKPFSTPLGPVEKTLQEKGIVR